MHRFKKRVVLLIVALIYFQIKPVVSQPLPKSQNDSVGGKKDTSRHLDKKSLNLSVGKSSLNTRDGATKIDEKVKQETVPVIDKHPWAIYFALIAAGLAAIASLASSTITGFVTWKSKDKEYKNDFYKKVIDKRIKAIESAEHLLSLFSSVSAFAENNKFYFSFFDDSEKNEKWETRVDEVAALNMWYSQSTSRALMSLTQSVSEVLEEIKASENADFSNICIAKHELIESRKIIIENSIGNDMRKLYDIDAFFKSKLKSK